MSPGRAFLEPLFPERREIRPHGEGVHVLDEERRGRLPEKPREERGEAVEVASVRDSGVRGDAALVLEMASKGAKVVLETQLLVTAKLRTSFTSALISSSESFFPKAGILS